MCAEQFKKCSWLNYFGCGRVCHAGGMRRSLTVLGAALLLALLPASPVHAVTSRPGGVLLLGESITWQTCSGSGQRFPSIAPRVLRERDGGCHGWSGATTADMIYQIHGGRFVSNGDGQPYPHFPGRGQRDAWSVREAIDRAGVIAIGLGPAEAGRPGWQRDSPWPIRKGPGGVPGRVSPQQLAKDIDYIVGLAQGKPVFWYDIGTVPGALPSPRIARAYNDQIWHAMARHPNFHVLPWSTKVREDPGLLRGTDIHVTDRGRAVRWQLLADAAGPHLR